MTHIAAVIVTMRRPRELARLLHALEQQRRRADLVIVVENAPGAETAEVVARHSGVRHLVSRRNLGGAGGFAFGIFSALAEGATHVWLMDDDGLPADAACLEGLLAGLTLHGADLASPVIVDIDDEERLAFPYRVGGRQVRMTAELDGAGVIRDFAHLFNGALVRSDAFARFGVPDYRLFLRGDEVDFLHSLRRGGGLVITLPDVAFRHPSGASETVPILGGRLHAVVPTGDLKQFHFFRNRGYLIRRHRLVLQACSDAVRYPWYYLVTRNGDWRGFSRWLGLALRGLRQDFRPYEAPPLAVTPAAQPLPEPASSPSSGEGRDPVPGVRSGLTRDGSA